jgi:hypothetical protein
MRLQTNPGRWFFFFFLAPLLGGQYDLSGDVAGVTQFQCLFGLLEWTTPNCYS